MKQFATALILAILGVLSFAQACYAHPLAPALLQLEQTGINTWQLLWRQSSLQQSRTPLEPALPAHCTRVSPIEVTQEPGAAVTAAWQLHCTPGELAGAKIGVTHLERSPISVILRVQHRNGESFTSLLDAGQTRATIPVPSKTTTVALRYLELGVTHLVFGPDHLLFLLLLVLLVAGWRKLVVTLTAFTLGHSVTLSLAALGLIQVNAALMEVGIALSLIVVARELLARKRSIIGRHPAILAGMFGLLHGLGFAGALAAIGLPQQDVVPALLAFNLGIELGQLWVVASVYALYVAAQYFFTPLRAPSYAVAVVAPAYLVGSVAVFWCIERSPPVLAWLLA